jgi:hypothetical protein
VHAGLASTQNGSVGAVRTSFAEARPLFFSAFPSAAAGVALNSPKSISTIAHRCDTYEICAVLVHLAYTHLRDLGRTESVPTPDEGWVYCMHSDLAPRADARAAPSDNAKFPLFAIFMRRFR